MRRHRRPVSPVSGASVPVLPPDTRAALYRAVCGSCKELPSATTLYNMLVASGAEGVSRAAVEAALLDLNDPTRVIGRLREPLLSPEGNEREGYVPNVVYSCGSLLHGRELILPFAMSDKVTAIATVSLDDLLAAMRPAA